MLDAARNDIHHGWTGDEQNDRRCEKCAPVNFRRWNVGSSCKRLPPGCGHTQSNCHFHERPNGNRGHCFALKTAVCALSRPLAFSEQSALEACDGLTARMNHDAGIVLNLFDPDKM